MFVVLVAFFALCVGEGPALRRAVWRAPWLQCCILYNMIGCFCPEKGVRLYSVHNIFGEIDLK
ncbi:hypothetical protein PAECIP111891_05529 [Paenibacillus allorhizoplanae]|uniref:Secreted protein n=1 Tax=Paenibacillus allorhizoplanae TaxID=2905648 RepID=A0ABN8H4Q9_9BACL|nr:hypothetical protein PAECIP111891_05529 [Paenibacillus allorhizoplanae]